MKFAAAVSAVWPSPQVSTRSSLGLGMWGSAPSGAVCLALMRKTVFLRSPAAISTCIAALGSNARRSLGRSEPSPPSSGVTSEPASTKPLFESTSSA